MSKARLVVTAVLVEHRPVSMVARDYGVARSWIYELLSRYRQFGDAGLQPRSRRPRSNPRQLDPAVEDRIVELRKRLLERGVDAGPHTIAWHLATQTGTSPAASTIHQVLRRRGFITPQPQKRPRASLIRFQAEQPNECWQADITHWRLVDGREVEILNIVDDHSRYAIGCTARTAFKGTDVLACFRNAFAHHGLPASVLTDNGMVFTTRHASAPGGRGALTSELRALGIEQKNSRPYHPQTCGKVERFHQTLKKWLARADPPPGSITDLQRHLDAFTAHYNTGRPHRACGRRTPAHAYTARPKAAPTSSRLGIHWRVRTDRIDRDGKLTLRVNGRLHHIGIGRHHAGSHIRMLIADLHIRIINADGQLLRELVLDPTRDYQPQKPRTPPANR
jgi:transposase InsO family protein